MLFCSISCPKSQHKLLCLTTNSNEITTHFQQIQAALTMLMKEKQNLVAKIDEDDEDYASWGIQLSGFKHEMNTYDNAIKVLKEQQEHLGGMTNLVVLNHKLAQTNTQLMSEHAEMTTHLTMVTNENADLKTKADLEAHVQLL
eukprot:UN07815